MPVSQMTFKVSLPLYVVDNFTFSGLCLQQGTSSDEVVSPFGTCCWP